VSRIHCAVVFILFVIGVGIRVGFMFLVRLSLFDRSVSLQSADLLPGSFVASIFITVLQRQRSFSSSIDLLSRLVVGFVSLL